MKTPIINMSRFIALGLMLIVFNQNSYAQDWSGWQATSGDDNFQYRIRAYADTVALSGYMTEWQVQNSYSSTAEFTLTIEIPITNPGNQEVMIIEEEVLMHIAGNTMSGGRLDTSVVQAFTVSNVDIHYSEPDPESEEFDHAHTEEEGDGGEEPPGN
jgi:beta-glucanase (GH16 family)